MDLTVREALRRTFELATLRREARYLKTPRQWAKARNLILRADAARECEARLFRERFDTRVEVARRRLIDGAATPLRTLQPGWAGIDRFNPADLLRQAQRQVRADHDRRLNKIDAAEARVLAGILRQSGRENDLKGSVVIAFRRATDPPNGGGPSRPTGPARD